MDHAKVYKVYINDDPGLTLIYYTERSNLVKIAHCAYTRPIKSDELYMTIGPLVFIVMELPVH